jgi:ADP-heptose:LPS heptosyltransferase
MSKEISLPLTFRDKAIVFRGGGLGDFILTLPLLSYIQNSYREVVFLTKPAYFFLVNKRNGLPELFDLDHGLSQISKKIEGADIFTFWYDIEWKDELQNLGANQIFILASRPTEGSHIVRVMFEKMNTPFLPSILSNAWIGDDWSKNSNMWIHPGSGGEYKNMPFSFYKNLAENWLKKKSSNLVTFCFGEADWKIFKTFKETKFLFSGRVKYVQPSSVEEYKSNLSEGVFEFWGNDSGPGHLAANLGIPTNICFRSTNSSIWRPTGPRVNIHEFSEDSN